MRSCLLALCAFALLLAAPAQAQNFSLPGTYGEVDLDEGFLPDPYVVDLTAGGSLDVDVGGCSYGFVADAPDFKVRYATSGGSDLYLYAYSDDDTTLLINTPNGTWLCNDDGLGDRNPVVVIPNAQGGRYDVWVGTYGDDLTPAALHISEIDPRGGGGDVVSGGAPDYTLPATYDEAYLDEGFLPDPYAVGLTAGGTLDVNVGSCSYGYVANAPDAKLFYTTSGGSTLYVYAEANNDTTLLINTPSGTWLCNDDGLGNRDPLLVIPNAAGGRYDIWVGTYGDDLADASLYISEIDPR